MRPSLGILRVALGLLAVFLAHFLGRSLARSRQPRRIAGWSIRLAVALVALAWMGLDLFALIIYVLALVSGGFGYWDEWRPKHEPDLTKTLFPED